jgi:cell division protein FtsI/penicillin-binding protein 2
LHLAQVVAAIAHGGNAVPLHLVDAVRPPDSADWQSPPVAQTRDRAMLRTEVASALEQALAYAARTNPDTAAAAPSGVLLFGHSALAYAGPGETPYAWFYGYVRTGETGRGQAIVVIVVIEDERNPAVAARVARAAFESALSGENTLSS